jgi:hypothetical protein
MALQGEPDIHAKVVVPLLDALFAGLAVADKAVVITGVERLLQCMFTINVPDYMAGGKNRVIVEISAASMLFHHPEISKIQGNLVSSTLLNATRTANIQDPRYPHETPAGILSIYSKLIRADFNRRKQESRVQSIASSGGSSAAQWAMVANILDGVHEIKNTVRDVVQEAASQRGTIATLEGHLHSLSSESHSRKKPEKGLAGFRGFSRIFALRASRTFAGFRASRFAGFRGQLHEIQLVRGFSRSRTSRVGMDR